MWGQSDFEEIEELYAEAAEDYSKPGRRNARARLFFLSVHNLHDFRVELEKTSGRFVDDRHYMQLAYLRRGVQALKSIYWLVKNHCYTACYGRIRFLLELYLVIRELNREKEKTRKKWKRAVEDLKQNDYEFYEKTYLTNFFEGKRKQLRGEFADEHDAHDVIYSQFSGIGTHPDSIKSTGLEENLDKIQEEDILSFGLIFAYAMAAQYRRTFENSSIEKPVSVGTDDIMMQAAGGLEDFPNFLEEDSEYLNIV